MKLNEKIRLLREEAGMTQAALAARVNELSLEDDSRCSKAVIAGYERNEIQPSLPRARALAEALGCAQPLLGSFYADVD